MSQHRPTIRTFNDFIEESKMLPDDREPDISITDSLELYWFQVADKHGIIDSILNHDEDYQ